MKDIEELALKSQLDEDLVEKINEAFKKQRTIIELIYEKETRYLLEILPFDLKLSFNLFIYKEVILAIPFFQFRSFNFLGSFLHKFIPIYFFKGQKIVRRSGKIRFVGFLYKGWAKNNKTSRYYKVGAVFGEWEAARGLGTY